jgi:tetratricopeptide (TPR) repeat protein
LLQLARQQSGRGDTSGALESLGRARTLAPNSEDVLSAIAQVSLEAKAPVPAIVALEALTRICPSVGQYHYLLGVALMGAGDMPAAVEALREAERLEPQRALTLLALGIALNNVKRYGDARTSLLRSLDREPDSVDAVAALAEAEAGVGELDAADTHAQRALVKSPGHVTANLVAGLVLMERRRYSEARDALGRAIASDPASSKAHYQLSLAYARLGDDANAQKHVELYQQTLRDLERRMNELRSATGTEKSRSQNRHPKENPKQW